MYVLFLYYSIPCKEWQYNRAFSDKLFATKFMYDLFDALLDSVCSLNMVFDEHFRISDVHEMGEKFTEVRS